MKMYRMLRFIGRTIDNLYDKGPFQRWLGSFTIVFLLTFFLYLAIGSLLLLLGFSPTFLFWGAVGCGVGTGIINATAFLILG